MPKTGLTQEQLRERAIEHTIERMRKFGYEKVRLSDIARDLGVTHAALYGHFADKAALFDAVSERWLVGIDRKLEDVCNDDAAISSLQRITNWFLVLHRAKREKVQYDPEIFRAFNFSAQIEKEFVRCHMSSMDSQLKRLVKRAIDDGSMRGNVEAIVKILFTATIEFHHPVLVLQHIAEEQEQLLEQILAAVYKGLR
jgi:AcrR family transcriptional regulator